MGNFLKSVGLQGDLKTTCALINLSLAKIRELHGGFKSICDNFAINLTEFETIFASNEKMFAIWDTDNNGLIDALEMFAGLIIFADAQAEDKLRFLFDLFDFNQIQSISGIDLEFCIQCVLVSTAKIFHFGGDIQDAEITALVRSSFQDGIRLTLPQVLKWAAISEETRLFFMMFRMQGPEMIGIKTLQAEEFIVYEKHLQQEQSSGATHMARSFPSDIVQFVSKQAAQLTLNRRSLNFRSWLFTALQPIIAYRLENKTMHNFMRRPNEIKVKLEWIYGIRTADVRKPLQYTVGELAAESTGNQSNKYETRTQFINEELIYFISNTVVLFNPAICQQRHYTHHDQEVISCAISNIGGDLVATGELGRMPAIHIWDSRTLDSYQVIKGIHSKGVQLLAFSHDDRMLVSCGLTMPSACIIYEWRTAEIIISTAIGHPTQEIFVLPEIAWRPVMAYGGMDGLGKLAVEQDDGPKPAAAQEGAPSDQTRSGIVVLSLTEIAIFTIRDRSFSQSYLQLSQANHETTAEPICGIGVIADYKNNYFGMLDIPMAGQRHIYLTGHKDGKVLLWRSDQYIGVLADYRDEVVAMSRCFEGIAIATLRGMIHIWDTYLSKCMKSIELSSFPFKMLSFQVTSLDYNKKRLLVCTIAGDAVEITLDKSYSNRIKAKRINAIIKINGPQKALTILNQIEKAIMLGGDTGVVLTFDMATKELIDVWQVGAKITSLSSLSLEEGGFVVAAGTNEGNLIIRQDWEEIIPRQHKCGIKQITDVCFSHNGALIAVASSDKHIYLFQFSDGDYVKLAACRLDNGFPVGLNFSEDSRRIVICTNQRKLLLLDPTTFQLMFRVEDLSQCFWSTWLGRYPLVTKAATSNLLPIALGNKSNIVGAGDDHGNVYFWRDVDAVKPHIGVNILAHMSPVQRLELTKDDSRLITLGATDMSVAQWRVKPIEEVELESGPLTRSEPQLPEREGDSVEDAKIVLEDDSLINELNFCYWSVQADSKSNPANASGVADIRDDNSVLIRGSNNQTVNRVMSKLNFDFDEKVWKRPPALSLVMDHIYGAQLSDRRNTVSYIHFTQSSERQQQHMSGGQPNTTQITDMLNLEGQQNARLDQVLPQLLQENYGRFFKDGQSSQEMTGLKNPGALLNSVQPRYDVQHQLCQKQVVYFTSRFPILYNPAKNQQKFYQGHQQKISCLTSHPFKRLIASGEVNVSPTIHVWDAQFLETKVILQTAHRGGVLQLAFCHDGEKLVSIGMDKQFSIQIFQWEQQRTLAFRNLGFLPVFGAKFDPFNSMKLITCGYEHMALWRIQGTHLTCTSFQRFYTAKATKSKMAFEAGAEAAAPGREKTKTTGANRSCLISMDFFSYKLGHSIQSDALFGTSLGEITTFCAGRHFVLNEDAHQAAINCIKVSDKLTSAGVSIITGGEDGLIKVWDSAVQLMQVIDVRQAKVLQDLKNPRSYAVQSLDVYCCDRKNPRRLLIGVRCGEILEAIITDRDVKQQHAEEMKMMGMPRRQKQDANLALEFFTFVSAHSSLNMSQNQKKTFVAVYPLYPIMASVGDDETLRFWDLQKKQLILSKSLGTQASCLAFSPDSSFLVVGLINGVMLVLESKVEKLNFGTYLEEYTLPALEVIMSPKVSRASIIAIKFSYKGDFLAVSFNNEYNAEQIKEELEQARLDLNQDFSAEQSNKRQQNGDIGSREPSFVIIYVNRHSLKNPGIRVNSEDPYVQMTKIVLPLADYQSSAYIRSLLAVTSLDFSEDDQYLQMCVQRVNSEGVRYQNRVVTADDSNAVRDVVIVWNVQASAIVSDFESMRNTSWPDWSMAATINARVQGTEINLQNLAEERELLFRELSYMTQAARFVALDDAVCGSQDGGLYVFRFQALTIEKLKVIDFKFDMIRKPEMAATRSFFGHTSMIQSIEIFEDRQVLTTSLKDQCIIQWKVEYEDMHWELDFNAIIEDIGDPFAEVPTKMQFDKCMNEVWSQRRLLPEIAQRIDKDEFADPACQLELEYIIGRRAYDRRNNIAIDCLDRVTYTASSLVVFMEENLEASNQAGAVDDATPKIKQSFLRPEKNRFEGVSPELSCFCMSKDCRLIFIATAQYQSNIFVWEVTTNVQLGQIELPNIPVIYHIKVAHDNKHVLIVGLTREYYACIMMLDWTTQRVFLVRQLLHSLPFKIKDIDFYPGSTRTFVTCGIQHMCFWRLSGSNLEYQVGELTVPKAYANAGAGTFASQAAGQARFGMALVCDQYSQHALANQQAATDDDLENIYVSFLTICFINETLITGGDDGYLYLWDKVRIVRRVYAHEGSIFALNSNAKLGLIVSGGIEGIVNLWRLLTESKSNVKSLERLKIFNLRRNVEAQAAVARPEFNVQSVCLGYNRIIIGMRTGSIQEVQIAEDSRAGSSQHDLKIKKWIRTNDNEKPRSVGIDTISSRIFMITHKGLFIVYELRGFDVVYQKNYNKTALRLQSFRLSNKVMLVFEHDIMVLDTDPVSNQFDELREFTLTLNTITYATINSNEKLLGVATVSAAAPEVTLYAAGTGFQKLKQIFGFKSTIRYLDFSTDNYYMQVEDQVGEITLYEIETDRPIQTDMLDFELEWLGPGLRNYQRMKGIHQFYNPNNQISQVRKVLGKPIVLVADEVGTLRLFNYPNIMGQAYYECYSDHLYLISDCLISQDNQFFITTCEIDKSIFKWKIKYHEDKLAKLVEQDRNLLQ